LNGKKVDFKDLVGETKEIKNTHINIGTGEDLEIRELANLVKKVVGFEGIIEWDTTKPDGTKQKLLNVNKINELGWRFNKSLEKGINEVYNCYKSK